MVQRKLANLVKVLSIEKDRRDAKQALTGLAVMLLGPSFMPTLEDL